MRRLYQTTLLGCLFALGCAETAASEPGATAPAPPSTEAPSGTPAAPKLQFLVQSLNELTGQETPSNDALGTLTVPAGAILGVLNAEGDWQELVHFETGARAWFRRAGLARAEDWFPVPDTITDLVPDGDCGESLSLPVVARNLEDEVWAYDQGRFCKATARPDEAPEPDKAPDPVLVRFGTDVALRCTEPPLEGTYALVDWSAQSTADAPIVRVRQGEQLIDVPTRCGMNGPLAPAAFDAASQHVPVPVQAPTVVHFWATWCHPCIEELPAFEAFRQAHPEVPVFVFSLDFEPDTAHLYLAKTQSMLPSGFDPDGKEMRRLGGEDALPLTVILEPDGTRRLITGAVNWAVADSVAALASVKASSATETPDPELPTEPKSKAEPESEPASEPEPGPEPESEPSSNDAAESDSETNTEAVPDATPRRKRRR